MNPITKVLLAVVLLTAAYCSPPEIQMPPVAHQDAGPDESGRDGGIEPLCPVGTHRGDGGCSSTLSWAMSTVWLPPSDHHASLIVERGSRAFLFVVGGTDGWVSIDDAVLRAEVGSDGTLGAFETVGRLPRARAGHSVVELDGRLVVTGGLTASPQGRYMLSSTISAPLLADGSLGAWADGPSLPEAVMHHSCDVIEYRVHCFGGRIANNFTGTLAVSSAFDDSGKLMPWEPASPLPRSVGFHQSFVFAGGLYLAGGLHRDAPATDFDYLVTVLRAPMTDGGRLGPWVEVGPLPESLNVGAATVFNDRVYFVGGMNGDDQIQHEVFSAGFTDDGATTDFSVSTDAPAVARMHVHQLPRFRNHLFLVGGRLATDVSASTVEIGTFH